MRKTCTGLLIGATLALCTAAPASAAEEELIVPPANSAVNQYTEAFPTAGGDKEAHNQKGRDVAAGKVIGAKNAKKLESHGADGHAAARFAADTAPNPLGAGGSGGQGGGDAAGVVVTDGNGGGAQAGGGTGGAGNAQDGRSVPNPAPGSAPQHSVHTASADGSSGISEVLARATGSSGSGGGMGIFLPLLILAAIAWAIAYSVRQRRPVS